MTTEPPERFAKPRTAKLTALLAGASVLLLAGCGTSAPELEDQSAPLKQVSADGFEDVTAELDFENGTAVTPITRYTVSGDFSTEVLFAQAREALITDCMTEGGLTYTGLTGVDWASLQPQGDRVFGLWDRGAAANFGVAFDPRRGTPRETYVEAGPEFNAALNKCGDTAMEHAVLGPLAMKLGESTLADRILGNAVELALNSDEGEQANADFADCLAEKSIVVDPASGYPSSDYSELGKAAEIEAVLAEVDCNIDSGRIETLYNLRAQYESAYIEEYGTQVAGVLEEKEGIQSTLRTIIETAG